MSTTTPEMSLTVPGVGDTDYPTSISDSMTVIDEHDHTTGNGVQIPTGGIEDLAVTTAKINALAVTTAKIDNLAVTQAKRAALGQQISTSSSTFSTGNTSATDVTNLSVDITTTGRPVFVGLVADGTSDASSVRVVSAAIGTATAYLYFLADGATISKQLIESSVATTGSEDVAVALPVSSFFHIAALAADTYTIKVQVECIDAQSINVNYAKLIAFEL